jgi:hypothetical protein
MKQIANRGNTKMSALQKTKTSYRGPTIDALETMRVEITEAVELMREHFPYDDEKILRSRAEGLRSRRYKEGRWPDFGAIARIEAEEEARRAKAAEVIT